MWMASVISGSTSRDRGQALEELDHASRAAVAGVVRHRVPAHASDAGHVARSGQLEAAPGPRRNLVCRRIPVPVRLAGDRSSFRVARRSGPRRRVDTEPAAPRPSIKEGRELSSSHRRPGPARGGGEESLRVALLGRRQHLLDAPLLADDAALEDEHAVGDARDDAQVVRDEEHREAEIVAQLGEQIEDGGLHRHVERGGDLVADDEVGPRRERARDRDPLPLAAGQLGRVARVAMRAGRRTRSSRSSTSSRASARDRPRSSAAGRAISSSTRRRGFSESVGFWKTIWMRRRASRERLVAPRLRAARRRRGSGPPTARAGRRRSARSSSSRCRTRPTSATHSPAATVKLTSSAATTVSCRVRARRRAPRPRAAARRSRTRCARRAAARAASGGVSRHRSSARRGGARPPRAPASPRRTLDALRRSAARTHSPPDARRRRPRRPGCRSSRRGSTWSGIDAISPRVYGCRGRAQQLRRPAPLDDAPGVHHGDAVGDRRDHREVVA